MIFFPCPVISLDGGHHHQGVLHTSKHKGTKGTENVHVLLSYWCPKAHVQLLQKVSLPKGSHFFLFFFFSSPGAPAAPLSPDTSGPSALSGHSRGGGETDLSWCGALIKKALVLPGRAGISASPFPKAQGYFSWKQPLTFSPSQGPSKSSSSSLLASTRLWGASMGGDPSPLPLVFLSSAVLFQGHTHVTASSN